MKEKKSKHILIVVATIVLQLSLNACKESKPDIGYVDVSTIPNIEVQDIKSISSEPKTFLNVVTNKDVSILQSLHNTAFHFYNGIKFKSSNEGLIVGGTGLRIRVTENGGKNWIEHSFSRFSNAFQSVAYAGNSYHIVGESDYLFKTYDLGKTWKVLDAKLLLEKAQRNDYQFKLSKIHFYNDKIGLVSGSISNKPCLLKTTDSGNHWQYLDTTGFIENEGSVGDFTFISKNEIILVTLSGNCYKSTDGGKHWQLLFIAKNNDKKTVKLNSIAFKNPQAGFIGGLQGLMYTSDGGNNWDNVHLPEKFNVTDITFIHGGALITTAKDFHGAAAETKERNPFVFFVSEDGKQVKPFLIKEDGSVFTQGDSYSIQILENDAYILDRNNLYKTSVENVE